MVKNWSKIGQKLVDNWATIGQKVIKNRSKMYESLIMFQTCNLISLSFDLIIIFLQKQFLPAIAFAIINTFVCQTLPIISLHVLKNIGAFRDRSQIEYLYLCYCIDTFFICKMCTLLYNIRIDFQSCLLIKVHAQSGA